MSNIQPFVIAAGIFLGLITAVATFFIGRETAPQRALYYTPREMELKTGDPKCIICLTDIFVTDGTVLECGHVFHITCIQQWNRRSLTCPNCKKKI